MNTSVSVYIFKVFNPTDHFYSVPITVRINNVETNGNVLPLYKQAYYIFLDPRQPLLTQIQIDGEFNWQTGKFVGD